MTLNELLHVSNIKKCNASEKIPKVSYDNQNGISWQ